MNTLNTDLPLPSNKPNYARYTTSPKGLNVHPPDILFCYQAKELYLRIFINDPSVWSDSTHCILM